MRKLLIFFLIMLGCKKDPNEPDFSIPFTDQAIFKNAEYIQVPLYTYKNNSNGKIYTFHGTSNDIINRQFDDQGSFTTVIPYDHFDTISSRPVFAWKKTNSKYVIAAIFNERIAIDNEKQQIKNVNSIVWAWNTGMSTGQEGAISYNDGCDVIDGIIQYNKKPTSLENFKGYILAIWAWDKWAVNISFSSREIPFVIEE